METIINTVSILSSDSCLYPVVQALYILFVLYAAFHHKVVSWFFSNRSGGASVTGKVERTSESMSKFYGAYVAMAFIVVLVTLNVKIIENYRVFFVILNVGLLVYLCFWNAWFRNKLMGWIIRSYDVEKF